MGARCTTQCCNMVKKDNEVCTLTPSVKEYSQYPKSRTTRSTETQEDYEGTNTKTAFEENDSILNYFTVLIQNRLRGYYLRRNIAPLLEMERNTLNKITLLEERKDIRPVISESSTKEALISTRGLISEENASKKYNLSEIISEEQQNCELKKSGNNCSILSAKVETIEYSDKSIYVGQVHNGKRCGYGVLTEYSGSKYEGEWKNDKKWGKGKYITSDGNVYNGNWKEDMCDGQGELRMGSFQCYIGEWKSHFQHGKGVETNRDGSKYEGEFWEGLKHGRGVMSWNEGDYYDGEWKHGNIEGEGKYHYADGREYVGQWKENLMHGKGEYTWPNGNKYKGNYVMDLMHGQGVYTFADGIVYSGGWKEGKFDGLGMMSFPDGTIKRGEWSEGKHIKWTCIQNLGEVVDNSTSA